MISRGFGEHDLEPAGRWIAKITKDEGREELIGADGANILTESCRSDILPSIPTSMAAR
jgi:hypothetical protein